jgi:hypothetical protein
VTRALPALLLVAAAVSCAQARDAVQAIDDCVPKLDTALDVGYARIAERCPDLTPALTQSRWAPWLPADWQRPNNQLSAPGLEELRALLARAAAPSVAARAPPRIDRVAAVLAAATHSDANTGSWWLRFKDWLHRILTPRARADSGWLRRLLEEINLSGSAMQLIGWSAFALVIVLAGAIVANELRIAGWRGSSARRVGRRAAALPRSREGRTLEEIDRAAPEEQPALLLELIARRLAEQERLPPARALTAREVARRAHLPEESGRAWLAELVSVCERVRYSGECVAGASVAAALRSGRALLATLEAPPWPPRPSQAQ